MDLEECIQYIIDWYFSDTVELFDLVLADDTVDPKYSAITTLNRFWVYLQYKRQSDRDCEYSNIFSLFKKII